MKLEMISALLILTLELVMKSSGQSTSLIGSFRMVASVLSLEESELIAVFNGLLTPLQGNISQQCIDDGKSYLDQLNKPSGFLPGNGWALKMFDASAKLVTSGLLQGNIKRMGNFDSCVEVLAPEYQGKHCILGFYNSGNKSHVKMQESMKPHFAQEQLGLLLSMLKIGRCVPSSCSTDDVSRGFNAAFEQVFPDYSLEIRADSCFSSAEVEQYGSADWAMTIVLIVFGLIVIFGTLADIGNRFVSPGLRMNKWLHGIEDFSAYKNIVKIFSTKVEKNDAIRCINGLRFLSFAWVLIAHGYSFLCQGWPLNNLLNLTDSQGPLFGGAAFQFVLNSFPSVDTFFFIGATLLAYIVFNELDKSNGGNPQFWTIFYVHRYIRLTGVYAVVIGITATLLKFMPRGPNSMIFQADIRNCKRDWWTNILYINNLHWISDSLPSCMPATWYLANDMQFFLISPLILYPLWRFPLAGLAAASLWLVAGTIVPMVIVAMNDFSLTLALSSLTPTPEATYFTDFYIVPWCRFQPYVLGLVFGRVLHLMREKPFKVNPFLAAMIWLATGALGASIVFGLYPFQAEFLSRGAAPVGSAAVRIAYNGLHRVGWCLCLAWIILACHIGVGGPADAMLSWPGWIPLARISYSMYLVHYEIIAYFTSLPSFSVGFSHVLAVFWILALLCSTIGVALVIVILVEIPLVQMEKILFRLLGVGRKARPAAEEMNKQTVSPQ